MKIIRKTNIILAVVAILIMVVFVSPEAVSAIEEPKLIEKPNLKCGDPELEIFGCRGSIYKIDYNGVPCEDKTYSIGNNDWISIDVDDECKYFNWDSNLNICLVLVKGGPGFNVYTSQKTGLRAPDNEGGNIPQLSHINFCSSTEEFKCPTCSINPVEAVCEDDSVVFSLDATIDPGDYTEYNLSWSDNTADGGTFDPSNSANPTWTPPTDFTGPATLTLTVTANDCDESTCDVEVTVYPKPTCLIASVEPICAGKSVQLYAAVSGGTPGYTYSWDDDTVAGGTFSNASIEDPTWTPPSGFTGIATLTLTVTDSKGCTTTCSVKVTVDPCERRLCKCSLVVEKRDEAGNIIEDAVFKVDGIEKTTSGGEARWDDLECDTTYEVRELSPIEQTEGIHLGDCGERSTMRVVNKIVVVEEEEGEEEELVVAGIMEVLPFTGPAIPYSPFIGISTVLAGTVLYILSKPKKKR